MNRFSIIVGDITKSKVDAIVNAANTTLLGGSGVDGAIHRAAGPSLLSECRTLNGCKTGQAKMTKGYALDAKYVLHTVGPIWQGGIRNEATLLESCYASCLKLAVEHNLQTVDFPSISTGIYGYPLKQAAQIAIQTILTHLSQHDLPQQVRMVCFTEDVAAVYQQVFDTQS